MINGELWKGMSWGGGERRKGEGEGERKQCENFYS
jgi:hypothetical protein